LVIVRRRSLLILVTTLSGMMVSGAYAVTVSAQAGSQSVYRGDAVDYYIIIDGVSEAGEVDTGPLSDFSPVYGGGTNTSQTSVTIINGKATQREVKQFVMKYQLTPRTVGQIQIPSVKVKVAGEEYQTNPVTVTVVEAGKTDLMRLEMELSDEECYVGQPVLLTVKWYLYADIGDYRLTVPVLSSENFDVIDADVAEQPTGQQIQVNANGEMVLGTQRTVAKDGGRGALVSFVKLLIPKKSGQLKIEPASAAANLAVGTVRRSDPFEDFFGRQVKYERFVASSDAGKLTVLPLPTEGQPKDFYGLVGKYEITAAATPTKVSIGEPITLIVKVTGRNLKAMRAPELADVPGFSESFRLPREQAAPKLTAEGKEFTQTIRATSEKVKEVPAIPLVYFDAEKGQYVTVASQPIPLTVEKTNVLTATDVEGTGAAGLSARAVEAAKAGVSANYNASDALVDEGFSLAAAVTSPGYLVMWAAPLAVFVASLGVKAATSTSPEKEAKKRRKGALARATAMLRRASGDSRYESAAAAMKQYIGDRFDRVAGSLTADDCREVIVAATSDAKLAQEYKAMIERCEAGRYAGMGMGDLPADGDIVNAMRRIERGAR